MPIFNPDKPECRVEDCTRNVWRNGLCYEHWCEAREEKAGQRREDQRDEQIWRDSK